MPVKHQDRSEIRWLCARSVLLHMMLLAALPLCTIAAWWQVERAVGGNTLSWLYVFEWPAFAVIAVWFWWVLLTGPGHPEEAPASGPHRSRQDELLAVRTAPLRWEPASETASLRRYNAFLAELNAGRPTRRPRPPRRPRSAA